jgi:predicted Zn-ribbon and HTH transcriptional regulator
MIIITRVNGQTIMVVMVTCKNCGHEYQSNVLQTPDKETLRSEPHEDIMENCPKCNQISSYNGPDFYWE